jgi:hypothetical protein
MKRSASTAYNSSLTAAHERCVALLFPHGENAGEKVKVAVHLELGNIPFRGWKITDAHLTLAAELPGPHSNRWPDLQRNVGNEFNPT